MRVNTAYIKAYALGLMSDGMTAKDALAEATKRWQAREKNEQALDKLMNEETK